VNLIVRLRDGALTCMAVVVLLPVILLLAVFNHDDIDI